jgi:hypothetical protein
MIGAVSGTITGNEVQDLPAERSQFFGLHGVLAQQSTK